MTRLNEYRFSGFLLLSLWFVFRRSVESTGNVFVPERINRTLLIMPSFISTFSLPSTTPPPPRARYPCETVILAFNPFKCVYAFTRGAAINYANLFFIYIQPYQGTPPFWGTLCVKYTCTAVDVMYITRRYGTTRIGPAFKTRAKSNRFVRNENVSDRYDVPPARGTAAVVAGSVMDVSVCAQNRFQVRMNVKLIFTGKS